jgi:hypothetical protein
MADLDRNSYDGFNTADINIEFTEGDEIEEERTTVKKLSDAFNSCGKGEGNMKVYLRIRPMPSKCTSESTIIVESGATLNSTQLISIWRLRFLVLTLLALHLIFSDQTIVTNAPESSKRAQYTKLEERKYVSLPFVRYHKARHSLILLDFSFDRLFRGSFLPTAYKVMCTSTQCHLCLIVS